MNKKSFISGAGILFILMPSLLVFGTCTNSVPQKGINAIGYKLNNPDKTIILPAHLMEISGMTILDTSTVACVQDEKGVIYIFDLLNEKIKKQIHFGPNGDFEGIARVDSSIYVLRSDGVLFKIAGYESSSFSKEIELSGDKAENNEGLCYDKENSRLLIAPKEKHDNGSGYKENHPVYGFDIVSDSLIKKPVIRISLPEVYKYLVDQKIIHIKKTGKRNKNDPDLRFKPSEICIHPLTHKLYVLCSDEKMLYVFDMEGRIEFAEELDPFLFNKPEGLAFFDNGDMLVSNESGNQFPVIMRFNYKKRQAP